MPRKRKRIRPGDGDPRHGTTNGYRNLRCRCQRCRTAATEDVRRYMDSHPEQREKQRQRSRARYRAQR